MAAETHEYISEEELVRVLGISRHSEYLAVQARAMDFGARVQAKWRSPTRDSIVYVIDMDPLGPQPNLAGKDAVFTYDTLEDAEAKVSDLEKRYVRGAGG